MNTFFSGADLFETKALKYSKEEDAQLAKSLVKYNFDVLDDFRSEVGSVDLDRLKYGTYVAYTPYTVDEVKQRTILDYIINDEGLPVEIDGIPQKTAPYEAHLIREKKYTDLKYINLKKIYIHPRVKDIQKQVAVFLQVEKTYQDLLEMEKDGFLGEGMADKVKGNYQDVIDAEVKASDQEIAGDETTEEEVKVYSIYISYCHFGDEGIVYQSVFMGDGDLLGVQEFTNEKYPFVKGQYIEQEGFYGLGVGDQIYPAYISKCARFNQVFDLSTFEIKGGGFVDATSLPSFNNMVPGKFQKVVGLSALMSQNGRPTYTWAEMRGARPSSTGLEIVGMLDLALQSGSGATALLSGMPTQSQVDKTASGIKATIEESNARINAYLENFEESFFKAYAEMCYENYKDNLVPEEDLPILLDPEEFTYIDNKTGETKTVEFPDVLNDVDFTFVAVKRVLESEATIGKIQRFLGIMGNVLQVNPEFGQMMMSQVDMKYLVEEIAKSVDIGDLDKLFPQVNVVQQLMDTQKELQTVAGQNEMLSTASEAIVQKLTDAGEQSALDTINNTFAEVQQGMAAEQQGGPQ